MRVPSGSDLIRIHNLLGGLLDHFPTADRAMRNAHPGKEQAQVVVDLSDRSDRRTWVMGGTLLVDGNSRGEPFDVIHIRFLHLTKELAGIGGERLNIPPLTFGKDGVEGQRGFTGTGETGDYHQLVAWNFHRNILQIMFACTHHADYIGRHANLESGNDQIIAQMFYLSQGSSGKKIGSFHDSMIDQGLVSSLYGLLINGRRLIQ